MNEPIKFFNLTLPYETYKELKRLSIKSDKPISQIIRKGIGIVLGHEGAKMKTKIPRLSKTVIKGVEVFKGRILKLPWTKELSSLVSCADSILEAGTHGQKTNIGKD